MEKQQKRYLKIKKSHNEAPVIKKEKQLKPLYKFLIVTGLFILCIGAIIAIVLLLVKKYHS